jgi:uncharacterized protein YndB with AHSA1/START domain
MPDIPGGDDAPPNAVYRHHTQYRQPTDCISCGCPDRGHETKEHDMADIRHRVGISAPAATVYQAVATKDGLAAWWTRDVRGDAGEGGELRFHFGGPEPAVVMEVTSLDPERHVGWRCVRGPEDWVGTNFSFRLKPTPEETVLLLTNADWREPVEFMHHCSTKWGYHLLWLKAGLEGGKATPFPDDIALSASWHRERRGRGLPGTG